MTGGNLVIYNAKNKAVVDAWLANPMLREIVEKEVGTPVKVTVEWEKGFVLIRGPLSGRKIPIQDILNGPRTVH